MKTSVVLNITTFPVYNNRPAHTTLKDTLLTEYEWVDPGHGPLDMRTGVVVRLRVILWMAIRRLWRRDVQTREMEGCTSILHGCSLGVEGMEIERVVRWWKSLTRKRFGRIETNIGEMRESGWEGVEDDMSDEEEWYGDRIDRDNFGNGADINYQWE